MIKNKLSKIRLQGKVIMATLVFGCIFDPHFTQNVAHALQYCPVSRQSECGKVNHFQLYTSLGGGPGMIYDRVAAQSDHSGDPLTVKTTGIGLVGSVGISGGIDIKVDNFVLSLDLAFISVINSHTSSLGREVFYGGKLKGALGRVLNTSTPVVLYGAANLVMGGLVYHETNSTAPSPHFLFGMNFGPGVIFQLSPRIAVGGEVNIGFINGVIIDADSAVDVQSAAGRVATQMALGSSLFVKFLL